MPYIPQRMAYPRATVDIDVLLNRVDLLRERTYEVYEAHPRIKWLSNLVNALESVRFSLAHIQWKRWAAEQPGDMPLKEVARVAFCFGSLRAWCDSHLRYNTPERVAALARDVHLAAIELVQMLEDVDPFAEVRVSRPCGCFVIPRRDSVEPTRVPMCAEGMTLVSQASSGFSEGAIGAVLDHFAIR